MRINKRENDKSKRKHEIESGCADRVRTRRRLAGIYFSTYFSVRARVGGTRTTKGGPKVYFGLWFFFFLLRKSVGLVPLLMFASIMAASEITCFETVFMAELANTDNSKELLP